MSFSEQVLASEQVAEQLAFTPDGQFWLAGAQREIAVFQGKQKVRTLGPVWFASGANLRVSQDGKHVGAGGNVYSFSNGKEVFSPRADRVFPHQAGFEVAASVLSPNFSEALVWLKFFPSRCCRDRGHHDSPTHLPVSPLFLISTVTGKAKPVPFPQNDWRSQELSALLVSRHFLVAGGTVEKSAVFDRKTLQRVNYLEAEGSFSAFRMTEDEKTLVAQNQLRWLAVFSQPNFAVRVRFLAVPDGKLFSAFAVHPKGRFVAVGGPDEELRFYSLVHGEEGRLLGIHRLGGPSSAIEFDPGGENVLCAVFRDGKRQVVLVHVTNLP